MISGFFLGGCVLLAASALGLMEKALGPDSGRFPCVNKKLIWSMRAYTLVLAARAFFILRAAYHGTLPEPALDQLLAAFVMATCHSFLLLQIIRQRLPIGVWRRLQARHSRAQQAAKLGGPAGVIVARAVAGPDPEVILPAAALPQDLPPSFAPALERLARLP